MQVNETANEGLKRAYSIIISADEIEGKVTAQLEEIGSKVNIPGFRVGKVPMTILRQRYADSVMGEVLEKSVHEATESTLRDKDLRPAAQPKIEVKSFDKGKDLEFTVDFEVIPEVGTLDFSKLKLERLVADVADDAIEDALKRMAEGQSNSEPVKTARKSKAGDIVVIDFVGSVDGVEFPGGAGEDHNLELGSGSFIPGFEDQLIGAKAGDEVTVEVSFPDDYQAKDLAGKAAQFAVKVTELRESVPAEINDDLAKAAGKDNLDELKTMVREGLEREYGQASRSKIKQALLDTLADTYPTEVPQVLIDTEFEAVWKQIEEAKEHGHLDPEDEGKSDDELREEYLALAERRVLLGLLLTETGRLNNLEVTQQDMTQALMAEAAKYPGQEQSVVGYYTQNEQAMESLRAPLYEDKVVDFILELAEVSEKKVSVDDLYKQDEPTPVKKKAAPKKKAAVKKAPAKKAPAKKAPAKKAAAKKD